MHNFFARNAYAVLFFRLHGVSKMLRPAHFYTNRSGLSLRNRSIGISGEDLLNDINFNRF